MTYEWTVCTLLWLFCRSHVLKKYCILFKIGCFWWSFALYCNFLQKQQNKLSTFWKLLLVHWFTGHFYPKPYWPLALVETTRAQKINLSLTLVVFTKGMHSNKFIHYLTKPNLFIILLNQNVSVALHVQRTSLIMPYKHNFLFNQFFSPLSSLSNL